MCDELAFNEGCYAVGETAVQPKQSNEATKRALMEVCSVYELPTAVLKSDQREAEAQSRERTLKPSERTEVVPVWGLPANDGDLPIFTT